MTQRGSSSILIATFGSHGDLYPYLAIARELRRRGHRLQIVTMDRYRGTHCEFLEERRANP
jgi:UDP:flavonoid glycosyltransferase YjiC (YdhE family)